MSTTSCVSAVPLSNAGWHVALAAVLAALVGLIFALPHIVVPLAAREYRYTPLVVEHVRAPVAEETHLYSPFANRVLRGQATGDPYLYETRDQPTPWPFVSRLLLAAAAFASGSLLHGVEVATFMAPFLLALLLLVLIRDMTGSWRLGALGTLGFLFLSQYWLPVLTTTRPSRLADLGDRLLTYGHHQWPLMFYRFDSPLFVSVALVAAQLVLYQGLSRGSLGLAALAGVLLGALFYTYFYFWTSMSAACVLLAGLFQLRKEQTSRNVCLAALGVGWLLSAGYWLQLWRLHQTPFWHDVALRHQQFTHALWTPRYYLQMLALGVVYVALLRHRRDLAFFFATAFFGAGMLGWQQHVITGQTVDDPGHYLYYYLAPWVFVMLAVALAPWFARAKGPSARRLTALTVGLALVVLGHASYLQVSYALAVKDDFHLPAATEQAFEWLNRQTPPGSVVMAASFDTTFLLSSYTHAYPFVATGWSLASFDDEFTRLFITYRTLDVPSSHLRAILMPATDPYGGFGDAGIEERLPKYFFINHRPPDLERYVTAYERFQITPEDWGRRRLDYVWLGPFERRFTDEQRLRQRGYEPVYSAGEVTILRPSGARA